VEKLLAICKCEKKYVTGCKVVCQKHNMHETHICLLFHPSRNSNRVSTMGMIMSDVQCLTITDVQIKWSLSVLLTFKDSAITLRFYTFVLYNSHNKRLFFPQTSWTVSFCNEAWDDSQWGRTEFSSVFKVLNSLMKYFNGRDHDINRRVIK